MSHGKVDVKHPDKLWVSLDDLPNTLSSESLFPESSLDLVEHLFVSRFALVENYVVSAGHA